MTTSGIIVLVVFFLLNIAGLVTYLFTTDYQKYTKNWWFYAAWNVICGVTYLPFGIWKLLKLKM